jgi:hypothetical protein
MSSAFVNALSRAEDMASRTGRADHADTVARLYHILFDLAAVGASEDRQAAWYQHKHDIVGTLLIKLEGCISSSDKAFHTALRNTPLHGHLCALRSVQGQPSLSHRLVNNCFVLDTSLEHPTSINSYHIPPRCRPPPGDRSMNV